MKAEPSWLIPQNLAANSELLTVVAELIYCFTSSILNPI